MKARKQRASADATTFNTDLQALLGGIAPPIARIAKGLVRLLMADHPNLAPVVRMGWRSVNFRHPKAGFVCGVFPLADHVSLVFEHGRLLDNSAGLLQGTDLRQVRFIPLRPGDTVPKDEIGILIAEAIALRA